MINFILLCIGIFIPSLTGWLVLRLCEGQRPILHRIERCLWAAILGPTLCMLITTIIFWTGWISLNLTGFLMPWCILTLILFAIAWKKNLLIQNDSSLIIFAESSNPTKKQWIVLSILLVWTAIKLSAGAFDLVSVPTYWDDSFNNWNMRGKIFYITKNLQPDLQNEKIQLSGKGGINSYPPTVALTKTWLSTLKGSWNDSLINSEHCIWLLLLLGAFYFTVRRFGTIFISLLSVYLLASLPLVLIHGSNPYADIFVAMHLLITVACLIHASQSEDHASMRRWFVIFGLCAALLTFTKNEGTALYLPLCSMAMIWILWRKIASRTCTVLQILKMIWPAIVIFLCIALPWFAYKLMNHLSFGNAKYLSDLSIAFHADALNAIQYQIMKEANFLILPLVLIVSSIAGWRRILRFPYSIPLFIGGIAAILQLSIFIFTPLATEAVMQTGIARGMVQISPILLLFVILIWNDLWLNVHQTEQ